MDSIEIIIIVAAAFWAGWKIQQAWMLFTMRQILEDLNITNEQLKDLARKKDITLPIVEQPKDDDSVTSVVDLKIEQLGDAYYAYQVKDDQFIAQSNSTDGLLERIIERFPAGTRVVFDRANGGELMKAAAERLKVQTKFSD
jgi:hypothetical protein